MNAEVDAETLALYDAACLALAFLADPAGRPEPPPPDPTGTWITSPTMVTGSPPSNDTLAPKPTGVPSRPLAPSRPSLPSIPDLPACPSAPSLPNLKITVPGIPIPQGSLRAFARNGRAWATSDNPRTRPWKAAVTAEAARCVAEAELATPAFDRRPVFVTIDFLLPSAPAFPATLPDLDKLVRAILDALTGIVWRDDAQVVTVTAHKRYTDDLVTRIEVGAA